MIKDFKEYQESLAKLHEVLQELEAYKVSTMDINGLTGITTLKSLIRSHERITGIIESFIEDPVFKLKLKGVGHE